MVANNDQMQAMTSTMMKSYEDMSHMTNNSLNMAMQSASVLTKGYEELFTNISNMMKTSFENSMAASKAIMTAKSVKDAMDAQANAIKSTSDFLMTESSKISAISTRMTQEAFSPITDQMNSAMSMATKCCKAA